jgi:hypothetical protein
MALWRQYYRFACSDSQKDRLPVDAPAAKAYRLLDGIDLGSAFDSDDTVGHLEFTAGRNPCSNYLGVQTEDA